VQKAVRHNQRVGNILPAELIFERPTRHKGILSYINITTGCPGFLIALVDGTWWGPLWGGFLVRLLDNLKLID